MMYTCITDDEVYKLFYESARNVFESIRENDYNKDEVKDAAIVKGEYIMARKMIWLMEEKQKEYEKTKNPSAE